MNFLNFCMNFPPEKIKVTTEIQSYKKQLLHQQLLIKSSFKIIKCFLILYNEIFSLTVLRSISIIEYLQV